MKTLDEVIDIFEKVVKHAYVWFDEKTALMTIETLTDTLQYLRELRDMTDIPMEYFESGGTSQNFADTSQITCPKCHSEFVILPESNNALTWSELKQMERKPVWVEYNLHLSDKDARSRSRMWIIVQKIMPWRQDDELIYYSGFVFSKKEIGKTWQAYRKERL